MCMCTIKVCASCTHQVGILHVHIDGWYELRFFSLLYSLLQGLSDVIRVALFTGLGDHRLYVVQLRQLRSCVGGHVICVTSRDMCYVT